jgi:hypothetical protein
MKKIYILNFLLAFFLAANAQTEIKPTEVLLIKEMEYNFGKIPQGKPVYHSFEIMNISAKPLKLEDVQASCGCTTPEWNKDEIPAGNSTKIKVGFNAGSEGPFDKVITIQYNGSQTQHIRIKGEVWKIPAGAAPANASVQFLKKQIL